MNNTLYTVKQISDTGTYGATCLKAWVVLIVGTHKGLVLTVLKHDRNLGTYKGLVLTVLK